MSNSLDVFAAIGLFVCLLSDWSFIVTQNEGSWFQLSPLFKYRVDGKPVYHNDQIVLKSALFPDYNIQLGSETFLSDPLQRTELNVSKNERGSFPN
jgi:hypothetical protein